MAERIGWDKYEIALLIEACESVNNKTVSKPEVVRKLSASLRQRAISQGRKIDDVFRNENGISLQMTKMDYLLTDGKYGLPGASKYYAEIERLKRSNPIEFCHILELAHSQIDSTDSREYRSLLLRKKVDKSLLNAGLTIPKANVKPLCDALDVSINKGESQSITIVIDGQEYDAKITNVNYSEKYAGTVTYQIRYPSNSAICKKLNEVFHITASILKKGLKEEHVEYVEIFSTTNNCIEFVCHPISQNENDSIKRTMDNELRNEYAEWLQNITKLKYSPSSILLAMDDASDYAIRHGVSKKTIWAITDPFEYSRTCQKLIGMRIFRITHKKTAQLFDKVQGYYRDFLSGRTTASNTKLPPVTENKEKSVTAVSKDPEQEIQAFFSWLTNEAGMPITTARSYSSSLRTLATFVLEKSIIDKNFLLVKTEEVVDVVAAVLENSSFATYNAEQHNRFSAALKKYTAFRIGEEKATSALGRKKMKQIDPHQELLNKLYSISKVYDDPRGLSIERIMHLIGMPFSKEEIISCLDNMSGATKVDDDVYSFSKHPIVVKSDYSDFDRDKYIQILLNRFSGGLQFDSIDLEIFRDTYDSLFDEPIHFSDAELSDRLKQCGLLFEGRLFAADGVLPPDAQEKLRSYIENSFSSGNKVLYYSSIYSDLEHVFEYCFSLTGVSMLRAFIEFTAKKGKYFFFDSYMSTEQNIQVDHSEEIANYMLAAGKPVPDKEVYSGLSYISSDVIYREIRFNPVYQRNEKECYFHMGIFEFSPEDGEKIAALLDKEIEENGYAIWSHVFSEIQEQMPVFLENNLYLSSLGIRNALSRTMSDRYDFASEVISRYGENLSMADVYRLYAKHHAPFSDDDLYKFSKEIGTVIYFWAVSEEAIRVSSKLFIPKSQVTFDISAADKALETYLSEGYIFIKDVDSFLLFPNVGYEWNKYLLESYLLYYSKEFTLVNNGSALYNVAGAIVKRGGKYSEFVDICADALAESGVELKKSTALDYLAEVNLITRRSYKELDVAMTRARQIRNRKG